MKPFRNKKNRLKLNICYLPSVVLMVFGFVLAAVNLYQYSIGYFVYQTHRDERMGTTQKEFATTKFTSNDNDQVEDIANIKDTLLSEDNSQINASPKDNNTEGNQLLYPVRPDLGEEIGELYIPKLDASLPIYHGTEEDELVKGVGHYADSVLPGENDNSVLAGHRDTVFRELGEVGEGDVLIVRTSAGEFEYKINKVRIVEEDDRTVIVPKPKATLTVSTCYPFDYIGPAPQRYILVAYLAKKTLN